MLLSACACALFGQPSWVAPLVKVCTAVDPATRPTFSAVTAMMSLSSAGLSEAVAPAVVLASHFSRQRVRSGERGAVNVAPFDGVPVGAGTGLTPHTTTTTTATASASRTTATPVPTLAPTSFGESHSSTSSASVGP